MKNRKISEVERQEAIRIGFHMRSLRKTRQLTQQEVARQLRVSQGYLSKLEHGLLIPSLPTWGAFAKIMKVDLGSIASVLR